MTIVISIPRDKVTCAKMMMTKRFVRRDKYIRTTRKSLDCKMSGDKHSCVLAA